MGNWRWKYGRVVKLGFRTTLMGFQKKWPINLMILGSPKSRFELEPNLSLSYLSLTRHGVNNMGIFKQIYRELDYLRDFEPHQFLGVGFKMEIVPLISNEFPRFICAWCLKMRYKPGHFLAERVFIVLFVWKPYGGFLKWGYLQIIHFEWISHLWKPQKITSFWVVPTFCPWSPTFLRHISYNIIIDSAFFWSRISGIRSYVKISPPKRSSIFSALVWT